MIDQDFLLSSYNFDLPEALIAQAPRPRGASRLMTLDRAGGRARLADFADLPALLSEPCLFVVNNSKVMPARLQGRRPGGGRAEFLLLTPLPLMRVQDLSDGEGRRPGATGAAEPARACEAEGLIRPAKKLKKGDAITFSPDLAFVALEHTGFGQFKGRLEWRGNLAEKLAACGSLPLPPYIRRPAGPEDSAAYQTFYARDDKAGAAAAPTAGLHFTAELRARLEASGHQWTELTLYVGYGTFSPVRCADIREHPMHSEYAELPLECARSVAAAKAEGRKVVAVGTTAARVLEGALLAQQAAPDYSPACFGGPYSGSFGGFLNTFLYPGRKIQVVDKLITNFHLPESTLLMLVSAFAGRENILAAYRQAVEAGLRFFSYGDAMLIE